MFIYCLNNDLKYLVQKVLHLCFLASCIQYTLFCSSNCKLSILYAQIMKTKKHCSHLTVRRKKKNRHPSISHPQSCDLSSPAFFHQCTFFTLSGYQCCSCVFITFLHLSILGSVASLPNKKVKLNP